MAMDNYGTIKAKKAYAAASSESIAQSRRDYLPNLNLAAQQDYGTVNGQNGPLYGFGGLGVASSGLPLAAQNWNAAFGSLYLANLNWDFFSFGRAAGKVQVARSAYERDTSDLAQERFQHSVSVAAAYLNLLAATRLRLSQERNVARAEVSRSTAAVRALNGLLPGVDSSLANAELSNARIALTRSLDVEQEQENRLSVLMGIPPATILLDTNFLKHVPAAVLESGDTANTSHPLLRYYKSRIDYSKSQLNYYRRQAYPVFSLFSVFQGRGSGFESAYTQNQNAYTQDYFTGIKPVRSNYLLGIGASWNITSLLRVQKQVAAQRHLTEGLSAEYELAGLQLNAQLALSDRRLRNALANYNEVPLQLKSAGDAYLQKSTLYRNGLTTLVDMTQALYALNRAETDRDVAYTNVWQALLLKAAASGDLTIFLNEL